MRTVNKIKIKYRYILSEVSELGIYNTSTSIDYRSLSLVEALGPVMEQTTLHLILLLDYHISSLFFDFLYYSKECNGSFYCCLNPLYFLFSTQNTSYMDSAEMGSSFIHTFEVGSKKLRPVTNCT